jgi:hypothetical protein
VDAVPGFPGIYQVRAGVGWILTDRLYLVAGGFQSNIVDVPIRSGSNTANVSGSVDGLYPSSDPFFTLPICSGDDPDSPPCSSGQDISVMLQAGTFSVAFDIVPGARPFSVAAVGEVGGTLITIDPASGTFGWAITVPDSGERVGDFQGLNLWDYTTCNPVSAVCLPFPDNVIPRSRLSPLFLQAVQALPAANDLPDRGNTMNGLLTSNGPFPGSHFAIDAQNNAGLSRFGGFVQVPYGPFAQRVSTFKLYVDGRLIARKDLPYTVAHR